MCKIRLSSLTRLLPASLLLLCVSQMFSQEVSFSKPTDSKSEIFILGKSEKGIYVLRSKCHKDDGEYSNNTIDLVNSDQSASDRENSLRQFVSDEEIPQTPQLREQYRINLPTMLQAALASEKKRLQGKNIDYPVLPAEFRRHISRSV